MELLVHKSMMKIPSISHFTTPVPLCKLKYSIFSTLQLQMIEINISEHRFTSILIYCMFVCLLDFVWKLLMFSHAYITWSMFRYNFAHISTSMSTLVVSFCLLWQLSFFEKVLTFFMNSCSSSISKSAEKQSNWHIF